MPKINAIDLKPGNVLEHQNKLWIVVKRELVQPGKGGAFAQVELRDLRSGNKSTERFRTQETVERVRLDEKDMQFLYMEGDQATFMDNDTFEQISVPRELIGDPADFLRDGMVCQVMLYEGTPLSVEMPPNVTMALVEADPVVRGQTASSSYKPGRLENGRRVMIPPYIEAGTRIDTVAVIGGGARSRYWGGMLASILDRTLSYHEGGEVGPAFGAARKPVVATLHEVF